MEVFDLYKDIEARTNGEIYLGIVGPVRTGKSTFIKPQRLRGSDLPFCRRRGKRHGGSIHRDLPVPALRKGELRSYFRPKWIS